MKIENDEMLERSKQFRDALKKDITQQREWLQTMPNLTPEDIQRGMDPLESFLMNVEDDIEFYEQGKIIG
jgi:hypothetical protein